jgi:DHA1 family bicyclomycin/chloramphenicol resistance-like MFS transporter
MPQARGRITAIIQGARLVFCALGLQLAGYFYEGTFRNIGIIITGIIFIWVIVLFFVIRNNELIEFSQKQVNT